jgi:hypothetical protein
MIYHLPGADDDKGIGVFTRISGSPADRNLISFYIDAGLNFTGAIPGRPDDAFGIAAAYARISPNASLLDQETNFFNTTFAPIRNYEAVIEATYQAQIMTGWSIQPNFQYIFHPGGNIPNPNDPAGVNAIHNARGRRTALNDQVLSVIPGRTQPSVRRLRKLACVARWPIERSACTLDFLSLLGSAENDTYVPATARLGVFGSMLKPSSALFSKFCESFSSSAFQRKTPSEPAAQAISPARTFPGSERRQAPLAPPACCEVISSRGLLPRRDAPPQFL